MYRERERGAISAPTTGPKADPTLCCHRCRKKTKGISQTLLTPAGNETQAGPAGLTLSTKEEEGRGWGGGGSHTGSLLTSRCRRPCVERRQDPEAPAAGTSHLWV